jgi:23S rRNA G2445 N2-methylase RlmL
MPQKRETELPACYAMVQPGLESVAADEITRDLGGQVKKSERGIVVFRVPSITSALLRLRTVEDVFLLAWGSDALSLRAEDLDKIQKWTARSADWPKLLQLHHSIRPKPSGKPTWHAVTQMTGEHGYRRTDARESFLRGLGGHFPASWKLVDEHAAVEFWLTIHGRTAVCGLRLSDQTMRHRDYKVEHLPASLRPTVAAAMVRLAGAAPEQIVADPTCGTGTILAEQLILARQRHFAVSVCGGDIDRTADQAARFNLRRCAAASERWQLAQWDAGRLPLADDSIERIIANPPFGKHLSTPEEVRPLYRRLVSEADRVLRPDGRAVLLVGEPEWLRPAITAVGWHPVRQLRVRVLGQSAELSVWRKG